MKKKIIEVQLIHHATSDMIAVKAFNELRTFVLWFEYCDRDDRVQVRESIELSIEHDYGDIWRVVAWHNISQRKEREKHDESAKQASSNTERHREGAECLREDCRSIRCQKQR